MNIASPLYPTTLQTRKTHGLFQGKPHLAPNAGVATSPASGTDSFQRRKSFGLPRPHVGNDYTPPAMHFSGKSKAATSASDSTLEHELSQWDEINTKLQSHPHSVVWIDQDGRPHVDTSPPAQNFNKPNQTSTDNPLIHIAADPQHHVLENKHFVLVESRTSKPDAPRYLILPRPSESHAPYMDISDFLGRATREEKISLLEFLNQLRPYSRNAEKCYWANNGHHRHVPYLHVHFTPPQKIVLDAHAADISNEARHP